MLKKISFILFSVLAFSTSLLAEELPQEEARYALIPCKSRFSYVKLGGALFVEPDCVFGPGISFGCRMEEEGAGLDISVNYAGSGHNFIVTLPKAVYLCYLEPESSKGFYVGGGASFGWKNQRSHKRNFAGLFAEMVAGYDFNRLGRAKMFVEATLSQPFLPVYTKYHPSFAPVFTLSYGIGF